MRFWARLALIAWLLTGLLTAPAMAFGMTCHGGMDRMAMAQDMPMTMPMAHKSMPQDNADMEHKAFACAVHCLNAGAGFILMPSGDAQPMPAGEALDHFRAPSLHGLILGPPLEPPISAFV